MPSLPSLYRLLFGKDHIQDGDVISLAEHGRQGGVSTGQGFKFNRDIDELTIIDEVDANTTYIGKAIPGTATSATSWQIKKVSVSGTITTIAFPSSSSEYSFEWDERTAYTYS